ncbi:hypothetical protein DACRYDRAFT_93377 [Dacryopinax primogenitus]|uniref:Uncharacterized protein n=1 Tax=Dacryopinax primogenitus (strain DJM 731) TaxID=1858805 RepID=M5G9P6_DACPD|nr:uncharacterized protein DACRYDRAFT_93377 [Dacryopinax primogenitus]EJU05005.1 hypothetical protein DACRYDRAFT_93377 [Dacryopinax primogenitus]
MWHRIRALDLLGYRGLTASLELLMHVCAYDVVASLGRIFGQLVDMTGDDSPAAADSAAVLDPSPNGMSSTACCLLKGLDCSVISMSSQRHISGYEVRYQWLSRREQAIRERYNLT